ncbi:DUF397 domain-containing protein [Streptomyces niveiscabiei]|uniref:DUF397 domain-containing protein n=1 Tax=Streptomyces niveiscabiei TaxID=164115 RepID=UPI0029BAE166|nr:DUF397 domain-containing protein [Streptomyces niveiscabiei]MDX3387284.1 DUF397 domain-containing protein [Streptomyces niveiscabiei]
MNNAESSTTISGLAWFKSSHSGAEGGDCVEVAWRKSSYSGAEGGQCVEVSARTATVHVRDSKDTSLPHLSVSRDAWCGFVELASAEPRV